MLEPEEIRLALTAFVTRNFNVTEADIDMDRSLIDQGIIDSFGLVEITAFIEQKFAVKVREEDMTREAFGSMNKMARFVSTRHAAGV
jgi:acyl carrier protein